MLHVIYESAAGSTTDLSTTDHVRLPGLTLVENAEEGTVAQSQLVIEDEGGTLDLVGMKRLWAWESGEDGGNQVIIAGTLGDREIGRIAGGEEPFLVGADRRWSCSVVDPNAQLSRRVITGDDGNRPAETDIARLAWLYSSAYLSGVGNSLGYIDTTGAVDMDAADLRGQTAHDVINDCAQQSGKDFFLVPAAESLTTGVSTWSIYYALPWAAIYSSTLRLTNVRADVDNSTTFAVDPDMILRRTPERVYSGVFLRYQGGALYTQDATTANAFAYRDAVHPGVNLTTAAAALARANRYLADTDEEEDRITCSFVVPKEKVNHLRAGQRVQIKFSHLPGYSSGYTYARCVRREVRQMSDEFYRITVDLVGLGSTTATEARLMRPTKNAGADLGYIGGGTYNPVHWDNDGDNPKAGDTSYPLTGLIEYVDSSTAGYRKGLRVLGDGLVTVTIAFSASKVTDGPHTFTANLLLNGSIVESWSKTEDLGLTTYSWEPIAGTSLISTDIVVRNGDVFTLSVTTSTGATLSALPTGVGNGSHWLLVEGDLR